MSPYILHLHSLNIDLGYTGSNQIDPSSLSFLIFSFLLFGEIHPVLTELEMDTHMDTHMEPEEEEPTAYLLLIQTSKERSKHFDKASKIKKGAVCFPPIQRLCLCLCAGQKLKSWLKNPILRPTWM